MVEHQVSVVRPICFAIHVFICYRFWMSTFCNEWENWKSRQIVFVNVPPLQIARDRGKFPQWTFSIGFPLLWVFNTWSFKYRESTFVQWPDIHHKLIQLNSVRASNARKRHSFSNKREAPTSMPTLDMNRLSSLRQFMIQRGRGQKYFGQWQLH